MKTTDELTMLKEWIAEQREIYRNSNFDNDEKKLDAIKRQLVLQEITLQIQVFEKLTADAVINSWGKSIKDRVSIGYMQATESTGNQTIMIGDTPNDTQDVWMKCIATVADLNDIGIKEDAEKISGQTLKVRKGFVGNYNFEVFLFDTWVYSIPKKYFIPATPEKYMHVSPDLRKQLDEAAQNKIVKS